MILDTSPPPTLSGLWPGLVATPLLELSELARRCNVRRILVKDESARPLGNFKSLGGILASLRALARATGAPSVEALGGFRAQTAEWSLVCASDGNHGLAVAAAAAFAGTRADVYLHEGVPEARARRLANYGARLFRIPGTYDDAVDAAKVAAQYPGRLLIADTSEDAQDRVSADILEGYQHLIAELAGQIEGRFDIKLSHAFVQAGVGGLAAAVAAGTARYLGHAPQVVVVEPESAPCVAAALASGHAQRVPGDLLTQADMLSCGQASEPALRILLDHGARSLAVDEAALAEAPQELVRHVGPVTTPSGAAGLAGLLKACGDPGLARDLGLNARSEILLIVTEGPAPAGEVG
ncbi:MAG: pyridoxal-phosphate dependent enzyme [Sphingomonadales bacterium]|nr:pyridoxal-phosphate dependent enzyme [Sphingomonadales bacterium]MDE2170786.1 pyridoxal-phosphate dependent enzyme [Sphingomonadales bacterium]